MFMFAVFIASLGIASAGYAGEHSVPYTAPLATQYAPAPVVSYSSAARHQYDIPVHRQYAHSAPILTAPISHAYAAPSLSYEHSYAPSLSYNNYGYSAHVAPLATKTITVAQPQLYNHNNFAAPILAAHGYTNYPAEAHQLGYNNYQKHYAF